MPRTLMCLDDVEEGQLKWMWWPYIPFGCATLIFGPGGVGKSHIVCDLAMRITNGLPFPNEDTPTKRPPRQVFIMSAEDDPGHVLKPRLRACGADMKRVFCPDEEFILDRQGLKQMEGFMEECEATVCFLDPIVALMGGKVDMFRANEVRGLIQPLNKIAQRTGTAVIVVHHERKNKSGTMQDNAMGSADFVNGPRSSLYVIEDKYGTAMWHAKSNYSKKGPGISFTFNEEKDCIEWGEERDQTEPVIGKSTKPTGAGNKATAFIKEMLKDGAEVPAKEMEQAAKDHRLNARTLNRAKKRLGVESIAKMVDGVRVWHWVAPEDGWPEEE